MFLPRNVTCGTHYGSGMFCLTEAGEQRTDWVRKRTEQVWKAMPFALAQAKIDSEDAKNMADKSTKITIFFIIWEAL